MPTTPRASLQRAIKSLVDRSPVVVDLATAVTSYDDAEKLYVEMYDLHRLTGDMLAVAEQAMVGITSCTCEPNERGYHADECAMTARFQPHPLPDGGILKFSGGKQRVRYDQPALVARYANELAEEVWNVEGLAAVVDESGENIAGRWPAMIGRAVRTFAEAIGVMAPSFDSWRSGIAKRYGIDLKKYAGSDTSPVTVRIEGRGRDA